MRHVVMCFIYDEQTLICFFLNLNTVVSSLLILAL